MRFGQIMIFAAAALSAGGAAILVSSALVGRNGETVPVQAAPTWPTKPVLVAAHDVKAGDKLTAAAVREAEWPADLLPKGAFTSSTALFKGGQEPTLSVAIAENEPILAQRLLDGLDNGLSGHLNSHMRGVTIRVNEASGVGGFAQPEDRVDVLMTQTERLPEAAGGSAQRAYTKTLVKNVRILAADQQTQRRQQTQPPKTVTLEVTEDDAKKLTLAGTIAQLSLTLNKGESSEVVGRTIDSREIAALVEQKQEKAEEPEGPLVAVFRSVERKEYRVPNQ